MIRLAVYDFELVEKDERYEVNMGEWHRPIKAGSGCLVCLGGSVIAKSLNADIKQQVLLWDLGPHNRNRIWAMDYVRRGWVVGALDRIDRFPTRKIHAFHKLNGTVTPYEENPAKFKSDLLVLADKLEELGE